MAFQSPSHRGARAPATATPSPPTALRLCFNPLLIGERARPELDILFALERASFNPLLIGERARPLSKSDPTFQSETEFQSPSHRGARAPPPTARCLRPIRLNVSIPFSSG